MKTSFSRRRNPRFSKKYKWKTWKWASRAGETQIRLFQRASKIKENRLRESQKWASRVSETQIPENEATKILHRKEASKKAKKTARETFQKGGLGSDLTEIKIKLNNIKKGINFLDFIANNKILPSKSEARRAVDNKGFKIDDVVVDDKNKVLQICDFKNNTLKLSFGKKKHYLIKII